MNKILIKQLPYKVTIQSYLQEVLTKAENTHNLTGFLKLRKNKYMKKFVKLQHLISLMDIMFR